MITSFEAESHLTSAQSLNDAAQEVLLESDLLATPENTSLVAEVATTVSETGLVEASRMIDRITEGERADEVLRVVGRAALRTGTADRLVLHDYVVLLTTEHNGDYYHARRRANAIRRRNQLEVSLRRQAKNTPSLESSE